MKKLTIPIIAASLLLAVSCNKEAQPAYQDWAPEAAFAEGCIEFNQATGLLKAGTDIDFSVSPLQKGGNAETNWTVRYFDGKRWVDGRSFKTQPFDSSNLAPVVQSFTLSKRIKDTLRIKLCVTDSNSWKGNVSIKEDTWGKSSIAAYYGIKADDCRKILLVGNSFTFFDSTFSMLKRIARSQGHQLDMYISLKGGQDFGQHMGLPVTPELIKVGGYDCALLQDQSMQHAYYTSDTTMRARISDNTKNIVKAIRQASPDCNVILEATWAYPRKDWMEYGSIEAMSDAIWNGANELGLKYSCTVSPIVKAFQVAYGQGIEKLFYKDNKHNGLNGSYLKSCVNYLLLYKQPFSGTVPDCGIDPETAAKLRAVAEGVVLN